jgi:hypothetical protein
LTNITLTSLAELTVNAQKDLLDLRIDVAIRRELELELRYHGLFVSSGSLPGTIRISPRPGVVDTPSAEPMLVQALQHRVKLVGLRGGLWTVQQLEPLLNEVETNLSAWEDWLKMQEANVRAEGG